MRRIAFLLLILVAVSLFSANTVSAESIPVQIVLGDEDVNVKPGDIVTIPVYVKSIPATGVLAFNCDINYQKDIFSFVSARAGDVVINKVLNDPDGYLKEDNVSYYFREESWGGVFSIMYINTYSVLYAEGSIIYLDFKVNESAACGIYRFSDYGYNADLCSWIDEDIVQYPFELKFNDIVVANPIKKNSLAVNAVLAESNSSEPTLLSFKNNIADVTLNDGNLFKYSVLINGIDQSYESSYTWKKEEVSSSMSCEFGSLSDGKYLLKISALYHEKGKGDKEGKIFKTIQVKDGIAEVVE